MKTIKIFDASTVICIFQEAKFPALLDNINGKYNLTIPEPVNEELKENKITYRLFQDYLKFFTIKDCLEHHFDYLTRRFPSLHKGEIGVMSIGLEYSKLGMRYLCLLDDGHARDISKKLHLSTSGMIGFALWEKEKGFISKSDCIKIHNNFTGSNFRINKETLDRLIL